MMNRKWAKRMAAAVALLLAVLMLFSVFSSALLYAGAANLSGLRSQLSQIESKKKQIQKEINALGDKISVASEKKAALDQQIGLTQDEIDTTKALISQLDTQITQKTTELEEATKALEEKTELFSKRVRVMYEQGESSYLDVLLASEDLVDMLSRIEIVGQIMDYDKTVMEEYAAAKQDIADKKKALEDDKQEQETYQAGLQAKYDELDTQRAQQQKLMDSLNSDLAAKKAESEKMDAEREAINNEIAEMSRKAAQQAAAKEKASSSSSSSGSSSTSKSSTSSSVATPSSGTFTWPLPGYGSGSITSNYGYRIHPISGVRKLHSGVDIGAPAGTSIVAAASGTVVKSYMSSSYGNYTVISHGGGIMTAYAHQSKRYVSVGDTVSAGQTIGAVGSTGNSTGNHLHFEVYVNGSTVNPMQYFN